LGSGKGRVLLMAAQYEFKRIIGVEFIPDWHRIAEQNIRKFTAQYGTASAIESFCMDAREFDFPAGPLVVYLFNPFPEPVFAAVLDKLRQSALANPRPLFIAYRYPELETLLKKGEWLEKIAGTEQWAVYRNRVIARDREIG
jgi:predicted RNA methylase